MPPIRIFWLFKGVPKLGDTSPLMTALNILLWDIFALGYFLQRKMELKILQHENPILDSEIVSFIESCYKQQYHTSLFSVVKVCCQFMYS